MSKVPEVDRASVADVMVGCALTHHEQGFNVARSRLHCWAGCRVSPPPQSIDSAPRRCRRSAWPSMPSKGEGDTYVAGGVDSVTRTYGKGFDSEDLNPRFTDETRDDFIDQVYIPMGNTAENVAERYGITRERMDEFAKHPRISRSRHRRTDSSTGRSHPSRCPTAGPSLRRRAPSQHHHREAGGRRRSSSQTAQ